MPERTVFHNRTVLLAELNDVLSFQNEQLPTELKTAPLHWIEAAYKQQLNVKTRVETVIKTFQKVFDVCEKEMTQYKAEHRQSISHWSYFGDPNMSTMRELAMIALESNENELLLQKTTQHGKGEASIEATFAGIRGSGHAKRMIDSYKNLFFFNNIPILYASYSSLTVEERVKLFIMNAIDYKVDASDIRSEGTIGDHQQAAWEELLQPYRKLQRLANTCPPIENVDVP